jgi:alpha,alpha-trehalase
MKAATLLENNLDYGLIGNCTSCALVSKRGSIDWCCLPHFDSSSVFAKLLDTNIGGSFSIDVSDDYEVTQQYVPRTSILKTKFKNGVHEFEIYDFMPRHHLDNGEIHCPPDIYRWIRR